MNNLQIVEIILSFQNDKCYDRKGFGQIFGVEQQIPDDNSPESWMPIVTYQRFMRKRLSECWMIVF